MYICIYIYIYIYVCVIIRAAPFSGDPTLPSARCRRGLQRRILLYIVVTHIRFICRKYKSNITLILLYMSLYYNYITLILLYMSQIVVTHFTCTNSYSLKLLGTSCILLLYKCSLLCTNYLEYTPFCCHVAILL